MIDYYIAKLDHSNENDWEEFNKKSDNGSFFHTLKWKNIIENSYNYKLHYYLIYLNNKVIAIFPFCENTIKGFKGLSPLPHSDQRHFLINKQDYNYLEDILNELIKISRNNKFSFILITTLFPDIKEYFKNYNPLPYPIFGEIGCFVLDLKENPPEKIWNDIFNTDSRKYIKRFEKDGFHTRIAKSIDDLKEFYKYYKMNLEQKNRTPNPFSYFEKIWDTYSSEDMQIILLYRDGKVYGGCLYFLYPALKTIYGRNIAIDRNLKKRYNVSYYLYWKMVLSASEMKFNKVYFGESALGTKDKTYKTKEKFGCIFEKMYSYAIPLSPTFRISYSVYKYLKLPQYLKKK